MDVRQNFEVNETVIETLDVGVCRIFTGLYPNFHSREKVLQFHTSVVLRKTSFGDWEMQNNVLKMKKKNFLFLLGLVTAIAFCFSACSDDDDDKGGSSSKFVGTWESVSFYDKTTHNGVVVYEETEIDQESRVRMDADGTCTSLYYCDGTWQIEGIAKWNYKDGSIYITTEDGTDKFTVKEVTDSKMILETIEVETYTDAHGVVTDRREYYELSEYRKVSN